jgi:small-conductance mechanosensitive channel
MLIAGIVWCVAGVMVTVVGLPLEITLAPSHLVLIPLGIGIFVAFYGAIFTRLVHRHARRIRARSEERLPAYQFFNASSWVVMAVMMGGGMTLRLSHAVPDWAIAFFYSGLGLALFLAGLKFVAVYARWDRLAPDPEAVPIDD